MVNRLQPDETCLFEHSNSEFRLLLTLRRENVVFIPGSLARAAVPKQRLRQSALGLGVRVRLRDDGGTFSDPTIEPLLQGCEGCFSI